LGKLSIFSIEGGRCNAFKEYLSENINDLAEVKLKDDLILLSSKDKEEKDEFDLIEL
jgi:hypothetical protein